MEQSLDVFKICINSCILLFICLACDNCSNMFDKVLITSDVGTIIERLQAALNYNTILFLVKRYDRDLDIIRYLNGHKPVHRLFQSFQAMKFNKQYYPLFNDIERYFSTSIEYNERRVHWKCCLYGILTTLPTVLVHIVSQYLLMDWQNALVQIYEFDEEDVSIVTQRVGTEPSRHLVISSLEREGNIIDAIITLTP